MPISPLEGEIGIRQRTRPTPLHFLAKRKTGATSLSPGAKRLNSGASSPSAGGKRPRSGASSPSPDAKRHSSGAVSPSPGVKRSGLGASSTLHNAPPPKPRIVHIVSGIHLRRLPTQRRSSHLGNIDAEATRQRSKGEARLEPSPTIGEATERRPASPIILSSSDESHGRPKTPQPREPSPDGRIPWWLPTWTPPTYRSVETQTEELPVKGTQGTQTQGCSTGCRDQVTQTRKQGGQQRYVPIDYFSRQYYRM